MRRQSIIYNTLLLTFSTPLSNNVWSFSFPTVHFSVLSSCGGPTLQTVRATYWKILLSHIQRGWGYYSSFHPTALNYLRFTRLINPPSAMYVKPIHVLSRLRTTDYHLFFFFCYFRDGTFYRNREHQKSRHNPLKKDQSKGKFHEKTFITDKIRIKKFYRFFLFGDGIDCDKKKTRLTIKSMKKVEWKKLTKKPQSRNSVLYTRR